MTITFARTRREVLKITGATVAGSATARAASLAQYRSRVEAIGFDAFTIFDLRSIEAAVEDIFPDKGREYAAAWRTRLFEYTWLRTLKSNLCRLQTSLRRCSQIRVQGGEDRPGA
jgi:2-haloacid dehalogenase